jgi:hypothetical protein
VGLIERWLLPLLLFHLTETELEFFVISLNLHKLVVVVV